MALNKLIWSTVLFIRSYIGGSGSCLGVRNIQHGRDIRSDIGSYVGLSHLQQRYGSSNIFILLMPPPTLIYEGEGATIPLL
jgi:hypothetical protein